MTQDNFIEPILIKAGDTKLLINGLAPLVDCRVIAEENYQKFITQFKPAPLPDDIKQWIEDEAEKYADSKERAGCAYYNGLLHGHIAGATAMHDLLSHQIKSLKSSLSASERFRMEDTWDKINKIEQQRKEIERLKEKLEMTEMADATFAGSEAIEFGEWIIDNFFYPDIVSQEKKWVAKNVNNQILGFYGTATTSQLYDKYKIWAKQEFDKRVNERRNLNSEQEDERSVATKDDSSNADGKQAIDFGKFLTLHGYELYADGWALQKGKRCGKTNEQIYEQFKAQLVRKSK